MHELLLLRQVVNLTRPGVVSLNRPSWSLWSGLRWSISPALPPLGNEPTSISAKIGYRFGWHAPEMAVSLVLPISTTPVMLCSAWFLVYKDAYKEYYFEKIEQKEEPDTEEAKNFANRKAIMGALWLSF
jgi:hypothetical protein